MFYKDVTANDGETICNLFNKHFHSVFEVPSQDPISILNLEPPSDAVLDLGSIEITRDSVLKSLRSIDASKSAGPDGIHPLLIRNCALFG